MSMKLKRTWWRMTRWMTPGAGALLLGGCGLSDQQLSSILTSLVSTGLNTLITQLIGGLIPAA